MRSFKTLGIAALAAMAISAAVAASPASATVLCKENTTTCAAESIYPSGTTLKASLAVGNKLKIIAGGLTVQCTKSAISGKTTAEKGAPLPAEISSLTVGSCTGCKSGEAKNLSYSAAFERTSGGNGTVTIASGGKGTPAISWSNCMIFNVPCTYSLPNASLEGGNPASLKATGTVVWMEGSGLCPKEGTFEATYEVTSPKPVYASAGANIGHTVLCKENATVCPSQAATYPSGTTIGAEGVLFVEGLVGGEFSCNSAMSLEATAEHGNPLPLKISSITFSSCHGACKTAEIPAVLSGSVEATSGGNGIMTTAFQLKLSGCTVFNASCTYGGEGLPFSVTGGAKEAKLIGKLALPRISGGGSLCATEATFFFEEHVGSPLPLWVTKAEV